MRQWWFRDSAAMARWLAVVGGMGFAVLAMAGPVTAQCTNVPLCVVEAALPFPLGGWATQAWDFTCQGDFPYVWDFAYSQTGSPSVSAIGAIAAESPGTIGILFTNWNPFQTDTVSVNLACSKNNSFGGVCGAPVSDPGCPVIAGSDKIYCSKGPVPVCFSVYQERCQPSNQLYSCTLIEILGYCQSCPG